MQVGRRQSSLESAGHSRARERAAKAVNAGTATPSASGFLIGLRRRVPIAARRRRRIENAGRGVPPSRARGNAPPTWNAAPFPSRFKERSRSADAKIQQSASTSEGCPAASCCRRAPHRRSPSPKQKTAAGLAVGQHRDQGDQELAARRSATARQPIKSPITQPEMPEHTHATVPLGQRFRSARAEQSP